MYCRSYAELYGLDCTDPALRDPLRPARAAGGRDPDLRAQGAGRRAADHRRRRAAVAALRLRRGPGRGRRPRRWRPQAAGRVYNLVGDESVTDRARSPTRSRDLVGDVEIVHTAGPRRGLRRRRGLGRARAPRSSAGAAPRRSREGAAALRRLALSRRRGARDAAPPAPQASRLRRRPRLAPRIASLVLSWLTVVAVAGALVSYLASIRAIGLTAASVAPSPCSPQHARRVPGHGARRPAPRAVDLHRMGARRRRPGHRLHGRVPRGAEPGGPRRVEGPAGAGRRRAGHRHRRRGPAPAAHGRGAPGGRSGRGPAPQSATVSSPRRSTASSTSGSACAVRRHESAAL